MSVKELRSCTAEHMRSHADDFLPFLNNPDTGDMYTTGNMYRYIYFKKVMFYFNRLFVHWLLDEFEKYCSDVEHTAAWGGQLEVSGSGCFRSRPSVFPVTRLCLVCFTVARFDTSSAAAHRSCSGQLGHRKDRRGVWQRARHPCVCYHFCCPARKTQVHIQGCLRDRLHEPPCRYMRHAYGLGEHYNSVERLKDPANADGSWGTPHSHVTWDDLSLTTGWIVSQRCQRDAEVNFITCEDSRKWWWFCTEFRSVSSGTAHPCHHRDSWAIYGVARANRDVRPASCISVIGTSNNMLLPIK